MYMLGCSLALLRSCRGKPYQVAGVFQLVEYSEVLDDRSCVSGADDAADVVEELGLDVAIARVGMARVSAGAALSVGQESAVGEGDIDPAAQQRGLTGRELHRVGQYFVDDREEVGICPKCGVHVLI